MNAKELQHFRELLVAQRDEVLQDIARHSHIPDERVDAEDNDFADQANVAVARDLANKIATNEDHLLEKIDAALGRIGKGSYGVCAQCGADIPKDRLTAKPSVSLCLSCQTLKEESM